MWLGPRALEEMLDPFPLTPLWSSARKFCFQSATFRSEMSSVRSSQLASRELDAAHCRWRRRVGRPDLVPSASPSTTWEASFLLTIRSPLGSQTFRSSVVSPLSDAKIRRAGPWEHNTVQPPWKTFWQLL